MITFFVILIVASILLLMVKSFMKAYSAIDFASGVGEVFFNHCRKQLEVLIDDSIPSYRREQLMEQYDSKFYKGLEALNEIDFDVIRSGSQPLDSYVDVEKLFWRYD